MVVVREWYGIQLTVEPVTAVDSREPIVQLPKDEAEYRGGGKKRTNENDDSPAIKGEV